jgi:hypothetical protein
LGGWGRCCGEDGQSVGQVGRRAARSCGEQRPGALPTVRGGAKGSGRRWRGGGARLLVCAVGPRQALFEAQQREVRLAPKARAVDLISACALGGRGRGLMMWFCGARSVSRPSRPPGRGRRSPTARAAPQPHSGKQRPLRRTGRRKATSESHIFSCPHPPPPHLVGVVVGGVAGLLLQQAQLGGGRQASGLLVRRAVVEEVGTM